ncbi:MAG: hypothetical protein ACPL3C_04645 [Pyrobaculum sp.]
MPPRHEAYGHLRRELRGHAVLTTYGATRLTSGGFPPVSTQAL